jgi:hypothetical protein
VGVRYRDNSKTLHTTASMAVNYKEKASVSSVVVMMVLWPETPLVRCGFRRAIPSTKRSTSCIISRPPPWPPSPTARAGHRHHVRRTLLYGDERRTRSAASARCAAQQWLRPRLVGVARCLQDNCSQPTALRPRPSRFRQAIPRSGGSAQAEHAKVSAPQPCASLAGQMKERGVISTLLTSLGTSVGPEDDS